MPLPQCSRPALKSRELGFSLSVWQHITFVSPVLGAVGNSGFSRGATLSTPLLNHVHSTLQRAKHVVRSRPMLSAYTFVFYIIFYTIFYFVFYILYYIYICNLHLHFISVYCIRILHPYFTFSFMF